MKKIDKMRMGCDFHIRLTKEQKERLIALTEGGGFSTLSEYLRYTLLNPSFDMKLNRILEIVKELQEKVNLIELSKEVKSESC